MNEIKQIEPEYVYVTIPAEYICVYHRILAMMADYGEEMLKDCKANCTDRNSGVIECFNMFNSAVAARKLGKDKLAALIIKYIKDCFWINILFISVCCACIINCKQTCHTGHFVITGTTVISRTIVISKAKAFSI